MSVGNEVLRAPAWTLATGIADGRWSSHAVVADHVARVRLCDDAVNAVVAERHEAALAEAERADEAVARGAVLGPLHGVPVSVKEFVAVTGMPHTGGVVARRDMRATSDATVTARLRAAGAIVLHVTNGPEGGLWHETNNAVFGRTRNPHDLYRTCGGSSGGEAAVLAYGGAALGIGSDTGGSVRIPATMCGVVGFKPTGGLLPTTGHFPDGPSGPVPMMSVGPMARCVDDAWRLARLLSGPDGQDERVSRGIEGDPTTIAPSDVTVLVPRRGLWTRASPDMEASVEGAADALARTGCRVRPVDVPGLWRVAHLWGGLLAEEGDTYQATVGSGRPVSWWKQAWRWLRGTSDHTGGVLAVLALERLQALMPTRPGHFLAAATALTTQLERELGGNGVLLLPGWPRSAPLHRGMAVMSPLAVGTTAVFNVTAMPSIAVPTGRDGWGLPLGVQVAAARHRDAVAVAAARWIEAAFPAFEPVDPRWGRTGPLGWRWLPGDGPRRLAGPVRPVPVIR